jgi:hypothetical protein
MPPLDASFSTTDSIVAFAIVAVAAFLVTWLVTDVLGVRRGPYIAILTVTALALTGGYLAWSGTSTADLLGTNPWWGVLAGLAAAAIVLPLVRKLPAGPAPTGTRLAGLLVWEAVVYGIAEGLLLATLPVLIVWQRADAHGVEGAWSVLAWGALALAAGAVVTLVHHLGYAEFRRPNARPKLVGALLTCGLQALAFLLTGAVIAPVIAHIALHTQMTLRGVELPPASQEGTNDGHQDTDDARPGARTTARTLEPAGAH